MRARREVGDRLAGERAAEVDRPGSPRRAGRSRPRSAPAPSAAASAPGSATISRICATSTPYRAPAHLDAGQVEPRCRGLTSREAVELAPRFQHPVEVEQARRTRRPARASAVDAPPVAARRPGASRPRGCAAPRVTASTRSRRHRAVLAVQHDDPARARRVGALARPSRTAQIEHLHDLAAQRDHAEHRLRHARHRRDRAQPHDLAHALDRQRVGLAVQLERAAARARSAVSSRASRRGRAASASRAARPGVPDSGAARSRAQPPARRAAVVHDSADTSSTSTAPRSPSSVAPGDAAHASASGPASA